MSVIIKDGTSSSNNTVKVNERNRLSVSSAGYSESRMVSAQDGETYKWNTSWSADTGEMVAYIKCNSTTHRLIIDRVTVGGVVTGFFELFQVTGTAAGTTMTGKNMNLTAGNSANATGFGGAEVTGLTEAGRIDLARVPALGRVDMEIDDTLILGQNHAIAIKYTGSTGIVDIIITGYFKPIKELK